MSITRHLAELLLAEHLHRPITGEVLLLGRQAVWMTPGETEALVNRMGVRRPDSAFIEVGKIPHPFGKDLISDTSFFSLFTDAAVKACDVSDHENADFIFNLAGNIPQELIGRFDFIYNGSVLDNVFDPVACIRNVTRMLKPNGVMYGYEGIAHSGASYLKFSPEWFFDYYALNGFADVQSYVATCDDFHKCAYDVYEWSAFTESGVLAKPMLMTKDAMIVVFAQKSPNSTWDKSPIQGVYRSEQHEVYRAANTRYAASPRRAALASVFPPLPPPSPVPVPGLMGLLGKKKLPKPEPATDGHRYLGKLGSPEFLGD